MSSTIPVTVSDIGLPASPIVFVNAGEIDTRLIFVMGTNVKTSASAIGTFGTGLKYAIAVVLRLGGNIEIRTGDKLIRFATQDEVIRDKTFGFIYMTTRFADGSEAVQQLGFTTELGKNWEPWMAFRELYCNAVDEGGHAARWDGKHLTTYAEKTAILVICPEITNVYATKSKWFLETGSASRTNYPLVKTPTVEFYPYRGDNVFFYKGIKVGEFTHRPKFTYNFLSGLTLTEDRTCNEYYAYYILSSAIMKDVTTTNVLQDILIPKENDQTMEAQIPWSSCYERPSDAILKFIGDKRKTHRALLPSGLMSRLASYLPTEEPSAVYLTENQSTVLERARDFLLRMGIIIRAQVRVVESLGGTYTGAASSSTLYIPVALLERGAKAVATTLLMEWLVNEQGLSNVEASDWLANKVLAQAEELLNELV